MDRGGSDDIMSYLEERQKPLNYIIAAKFYQPIQRQRLIAGSENWLLLDNGIEKQYQA